MRDALIMGKDANANAPFRMSPATLAHTFITGQSGCGKSQLLGRFIEELILCECGSVVFFDLNYEFARFDQIDPAAFGLSYNLNVDNRDELKTFESEWDAHKKRLEYLHATEIRVKYGQLTSQLQTHLLGVDEEKTPGAYWLVQLLREDKKLSPETQNRDVFRGLLKRLARWSEGRVASDELDRFAEVVHEVRTRMSVLDVTRIVNGGERICSQPRLLLGDVVDRGGILIDSALVESLYSGVEFLGMDLLNFGYDEREVRDLVVLHSLRQLWQVATERFRIGKDSGKDNLRPVFVVIDEAHNVVPRDSAELTWFGREVVRIVKTIAAEGRKFGLFLVLVSQRPDKLDAGVVSECDNFVVMKSTHPSLEIIKKYLPTQNRSGVDGAAEFGAGRAFYCGKFTGYRLVEILGSIRRTMK